MCVRERSHLENSHELDFELGTGLHSMTMGQSKIKIGAMNVMNAKYTLIIIARNFQSTSMKSSNQNLKYFTLHITYKLLHF